MRTQKTVLVVVQEGGATGEYYAHSFNTRRDAAGFRRSCARAAYRTTAPVEVPACTDLDALQRVLDAAGDALA